MRFVLHRHQASQLHYDFRLEMDGVLKSWAVPKGPPLAPGLRRLAIQIQVEDHVLDYIDFAGVIPEGEYGAGKVEIWDRGEYQLLKREPDRLDFRLQGQKLEGAYLLLRTGGENWLWLRKKD